MSLIRRTELFDPFYYTESTASIFAPKTLTFPSFIEEEIEDLAFSLDLFIPKPTLFDSVTDLIQISETPSFRSYRRVLVDETPSFLRTYRRFQRRVGTELGELCDRVSELEWRFDKALRAKRLTGSDDRKYTWTAAIEGPELERKYKWTTEMKGGKKKEERWTAEISRKGDEGRKYKWTAEIKGIGEAGAEGSESVKKESKAKAEKKNNKKKESKTRVVEIEDVPVNHGAIVLREVF